MISTISQALQRGDVSAALSAAQAFAVSDAQNPQAHQWLSICLQRSGDIAGARAAIDQAINLAPDRADFQISRAALALGQKDYSAAEKGMQDAVNLDPNQLQAYVTLAHLALARGENEEAGKQLKLAQRIDQNHPQVLLLEGHLAQYGGQSDQAMKCFTAAAELAPKNSLAQTSLGMAYASRGMWPFAEQALKNALALEPGNPGVMRGLVRSQLHQEKWPEAIDTLGQWLINKPSDHSVRMMRAQVRAQIGQVEESIEDLTMVNEGNPANPQVLSPLVNALLAMGRPVEALEKLEAALAINPQNNALWLMRTSITSNQLPATLEVLQRWLAALPESPQAHEALAQVRGNHRRIRYGRSERRQGVVARTESTLRSIHQAACRDPQGCESGIGAIGETGACRVESGIATHGVFMAWSDLRQIGAIRQSGREFQTHGGPSIGAISVAANFAGTEP